MTTANFVDVHVLGEPDQVRLGMKAIAAFLLKELGEEEGAVVGKPLPIKAAGRPWPATGAHQAMGAVFEGGSTAPPLNRLKDFARAGLAAAPYITVVVQHWDLDNEGVRMQVSRSPSAGKIDVVTSMEKNMERLEKELGMDWNEAVANDDLVDAIGDLLLSSLLAKPVIKVALAPLEARAKRDKIEAVLPKVKALPKPRF